MVIRDTDYIQQLANYIKKNLQKKYTSDSLRFALLNQGYSRAEVDRAIRLANEQMAKEAPKMIEKPVIKYEVESVGEEGEVKIGFWARIKKWFS
ncbi:MAG: hypothetical protein ABIH72_03460 [archaeon]